MNIIRHVLAWLLALPIQFYRFVISPMTPANCRFEPTCSAYALEALKTHGPLTGLWLGVRRLARCHPWGGHGYDPVPRAGHSCGHRTHEPHIHR